MNGKDDFIYTNDTSCRGVHNFMRYSISEYEITNYVTQERVAVRKI
jgi:hypothetical protein